MTLLSSISNIVGGWVRALIRHGQTIYRAIGLLMTIALILLITGASILTSLARNVIQGETQRIDESIMLWMHRHATPTVDKIALQVTSIGNGAVVVVFCLVIAFILWSMKHKLPTLVLIIGVVGADLIQRILKLAFDRPRPELFTIATPYARPLSSSFPSGHAAGAMAFYLLIGYIIARLGGTTPIRVFSITLSAALVIAIGASRIYLGVHYPSDVVAGYLVGLVWVALCISVIEATNRLRQRPGRRLEPQQATS